MNTTNADIRLWAFQNNVKMYKIAEKLHIHYATLNSKLRKELPTEEKRRIFSIINDLKEEE